MNNFLIPLGVDLNGRHYWKPISEMDHTRIVSTTQYGKTTLLRSWQVALCRQHSPDELRFVVIDGKKFELNIDGSPWLADFCHGRVMLDVEESELVIRQLFQEVERRQDEFRRHRITTVQDYFDRTGIRLPLIVLFFDEIKDMFDAGMETRLFYRILQVGLRTGVHVVVATQYGSGRYLEKTNFTTTIGLRLNSGEDSDMVFGSREPFYTLKNASRGEFIVNSAGLHQVHLKGFFVSEDEHRKVLTTPFVKTLTEDEVKLVQLSYYKLGGKFSVDELTRLAKSYVDTQEWTNYRIATTAREWESAGLLEPATRNELGHPIPRKVTKRLLDLL